MNTGITTIQPIPPQSFLSTAHQNLLNLKIKNKTNKKQHLNVLDYQIWMSEANAVTGKSLCGKTLKGNVSSVLLEICETVLNLNSHFLNVHRALGCVYIFCWSYCFCIVHFRLMLGVSPLQIFFYITHKRLTNILLHYITIIKSTPIYILCQNRKNELVCTVQQEVEIPIKT